MGIFRLKGNFYGFPGCHVHVQGFTQGDDWRRFSTVANKLSAFTLGVRMVSIRQHNRDRSGAAAAIPSYSEIIGFPGSQGVCNLKLAVYSETACKPFALGIIEIAIGVSTTEGGPEDVFMGLFRHKGNFYGFPGCNTHVQTLIQGDARSYRSAATANKLPTFIFGVGMLTKCQQNRDRSATAGAIPFYPKIIGLSGGQGISNLKLAVSSVTACKLITVGVIDVAIGGIP